MKPSTYDFRQFQEELAALDRSNRPQDKERPMRKKESASAHLAQAKAAFLALRERYGLTVADVVAFFPEEEGIAYLQSLIAEKEAKPGRRSKSPR
ncbi:MAG TPA: 2-hydroxyacyl-CoA dehydratase [Frateuria sp.]|uniref:2-hydroxyacyl-CoA dehydratase n=1 Tax=Frateuria sp. TaxID=2211372 RepID=UPI002D7E88C9|nr:2-hydroxyacyl-CoA dehydratase [Frateuria sp.]HET6805187.1 2-hydroxyacyl-CoA dehydratase [Frateuria sp.]